MTIGERIREIRKFHNLTQSQFAAKIGLKQNSIALIEGGRNTSDQTILAICREFKVNEVWLRSGQGEMFLEASTPSAEAASMDKRLKMIREILDLTQGQFADALHIKQTTVSSYELGRIVPSEAIIAGICREFNVNEEWLRTGQGEKFIPEPISSIDTIMREYGSSLKDRIKTIRASLNLTQQEFADRIGIKRGAIANYEIGGNNPIDAVISLICREFNVNEIWLRSGRGEMFRPASSSSINAVVQEYGLSEPSRIFLEKFLNLAPEHKTVLLNFIKDVASALSNAERSDPTRQEMDIDAEIANYRRYLESKIDM